MEYQKVSSDATFSKKLSNSHSFGGKSIYDGVFSSIPAAKAGSRVVDEDYSEIFGGSACSSIPTLDLPELNERKVSVDVHSSRLDYSKIFGGFGDFDFAASHEQLFATNNKPKKIDTFAEEDEPGTPAQTGLCPDFLEENQVCSRGTSGQSLDGVKQFKMSYHKTNQGRGNGINGTIHIAQLNAVPGYSCLINEVAPSQMTEGDKPPSVLNKSYLNINFSGELTEGKDGRKTVSSSPVGGAGKVASGAVKFQKKSSRTRSNSVDMSFGTLENGFWTHPSKVPLSSSQLNNIGKKKGDFERSLSSKFGVSKSHSSENAAGFCSPPYFDEEVDSNSVAAASAAAVKKAIEEAQAKIRLAKEIMERKKEGCQNHVKRRFNEGLKAAERKEGNNTSNSNKSQEEAWDKCGKVDIPMQVFPGLGTIKSVKTGQVTPDLREGDKLSFTKAALGEMHGNKKNSTLVDRRQGEMKELEAEELGESGARMMRTMNVSEREDKGFVKKMFDKPEENGKKLKAVEEAHKQEEVKKLKVVIGACELNECANEPQSDQEVNDQEEYEMKSTVAGLQEETYMKPKPVVARLQEDSNTRPKSMFAQLQEENDTASKSTVAQLQEDTDTTSKSTVAGLQEETDMRPKPTVARLQEDSDMIPNSTFAQLQEESDTTSESAVAQLQEETDTTSKSKVARLREESDTTSVSTVSRLQEETDSRPESTVAQLQEESDTTSKSAVSRQQEETDTTSESTASRLQEETETTSESVVAQLQEEADLTCESVVARLQEEADLTCESVVARLKEETDTTSKSTVSQLQEETDMTSESTVSWLQEETDMTSESVVARLQEETDTTSESVVARLQEETDSTSQSTVAQLQEETDTTSESTAAGLQEKTDTTSKITVVGLQEETDKSRLETREKKQRRHWDLTAKEPKLIQKVRNWEEYGMKSMVAGLLEEIGTKSKASYTLETCERKQRRQWDLTGNRTKLELQELRDSECMKMRIPTDEQKWFENENNEVFKLEENANISEDVPESRENKEEQEIFYDTENQDILSREDAETTSDKAQEQQKVGVGTNVFHDGDLSEKILEEDGEVGVKETLKKAVENGKVCMEAYQMKEIEKRQKEIPGWLETEEIRTTIEQRAVDKKVEVTHKSLNHSRNTLESANGLCNQDKLEILSETVEVSGHEENNECLEIFQHEERRRITEGTQACREMETETESSADEMADDLEEKEAFEAITGGLPQVVPEFHKMKHFKDTTEDFPFEYNAVNVIISQMDVQQKQCDQPANGSQTCCNSGKHVEELACESEENFEDVEEVEIAMKGEEDESNSEFSDEDRWNDVEEIMEASPMPSIFQEKDETMEVANEMETSQNTEKDEENLSETSTTAEREAEGTMQKEVARNEECVRKIDEAKEKEREREKERIAVERAIREARERAFAGARERAERAAVERATAEARRRAVAEAREKLEKVSAEANDKLSADKSSTEAILKAQRAAVERATAEARERALEKAMSEKAAFEARNQAGKFSGASRDNGKKRNVPSNDSRHKGSGPSRSSGDPSPNHDVTHSTAKSDKVDGESAQRHKAKLERHQRTAERAAKALAEKNMRDLLSQKEQAERSRLAETVDADVKRWSSGKQGNLRALLSTLQYILGPNSGWQPVPLTDLIATTAVKKTYRKATLFVHPDKLQQRGASIQQKYICEKVFDLLKEAWNKFSAEER